MPLHQPPSQVRGLHACVVAWQWCHNTSVCVGLDQFCAGGCAFLNLSLLFFVLLLLSGFAGRDWMFAAVSRWVAGGPYGVRQGELPWGPKVPREGPAQEALHTPWWFTSVNGQHPYQSWADHTRTAATAGPLSGLLVAYTPPSSSTAKEPAAGCVQGLVATYGRGAAAKKEVLGASTSRSNSSLQLAPGCWFTNVTVNTSPRWGCV